MTPTNSEALTAADQLDFYVSLLRGKRCALLAGPFASHDEALALVDRAAAEAEKLDTWAWFDLRGTCARPRSSSNPTGKLNGNLGVTPRSLA